MSLPETLSRPDTLTQLQDTEVSTVPRPPRSPLLQRQMPGLDILRGVAVLSVVFYHGLAWSLPDHTSITHPAALIAAAVQGGWLGVNLFFILSGFLITGILLDTRHRQLYWRSFYVRRVLRILPLYLVVLLVATLQFHLRPGYILMCLFYMANLINYTPNVGPIYGPLWSLAVEEQFYLVWPFIVKRARLRTLAIICLVLIVVSPVLRGLAASSLPWLGDPYSTTWLVSDNLAWGALVAIFLRTRYATRQRVRTLAIILTVFGVTLALTLAKLHFASRKLPLGAALQVVPLLALFTVLLLLALRYGSSPTLLRLTAPVRFFGYISYGLYLIHVSLFLGYDAIFRRFAQPAATLTAASQLGRFAIVVAVASLLCYLSRRYFEERFLLLKERLVPYESKPRTAQPLNPA